MVCFIFIFVFSTKVFLNNFVSVFYYFALIWYNLFFSKAKTHAWDYFRNIFNIIYMFKAPDIILKLFSLMMIRQNKRWVKNKKADFLNPNKTTICLIYQLPFWWKKLLYIFFWSHLNSKTTIVLFGLLVKNYYFVNLINVFLDLTIKIM